MRRASQASQAQSGLGRSCSMKVCALMHNSTLCKQVLLFKSWPSRSPSCPLLLLASFRGSILPSDCFFLKGAAGRSRGQFLRSVPSIGLTITRRPRKSLSINLIPLGKEWSDWHLRQCEVCAVTCELRYVSNKKNYDNSCESQYGKPFSSPLLIL